MASLRSRVAGETGEMEEPETGEVQIFLTSEEDPVSMRLLGVSLVIFLVVWCFAVMSLYSDFLISYLCLMLGTIHIKIG